MAGVAMFPVERYIVAHLPVPPCLQRNRCGVEWVVTRLHFHPSAARQGGFSHKFSYKLPCFTGS